VLLLGAVWLRNFPGSESVGLAAHEMSGSMSFSCAEDPNGRVAPYTVDQPHQTYGVRLLEAPRKIVIACIAA
jgi:hypothetical protein